jgi:hypothetical protein
MFSNEAGGYLQGKDFARKNGAETRINNWD